MRKRLSIGLFLVTPLALGVAGAYGNLNGIIGNNGYVPSFSSLPAAS